MCSWFRKNCLWSLWRREVSGTCSFWYSKNQQNQWIFDLLVLFRWVFRILRDTFWTYSEQLICTAGFGTLYPATFYPVTLYPANYFIRSHFIRLHFIRSHFIRPYTLSGHTLSCHIFYPVTFYPTLLYPVTLRSVTLYPVTLYPVTLYPVTLCPVTLYPVTLYPANVTLYPADVTVCHGGANWQPRNTWIMCFQNFDFSKKIWNFSWKK